MTKQLSDCCKAGIKLTGKERPNHFACEKCDRIIGTPIDTKTEDLIEEMVEQYSRAMSEALVVGHSVNYEILLSDFGKDLATKIYEDVEREAESKKHPNESVIRETGSEFTTPRMTRALGNNEAYTHISTYAREKKEKINSLSK